MPLPSAEILPVSASLTREQILRSMGILDGRAVKKRLSRHVDEAMGRVAEYARPRLVWRVGPATAAAGIKGRSRRLDRYLDEAEQVAIMAGTAGREMDELIRSEPDPMRQYVLSVASTALARHALGFAENQLNNRFPDWVVGRPLSPGNAGLPLKMQGDLIAFLPVASIGIEYDEELMLMAPLASITSIIGLGAYKRRDGENCRTCPSRNCPIRLYENQASAPSIN